MVLLLRESQLLPNQEQISHLEVSMDFNMVILSTISGHIFFLTAENKLVKNKYREVEHSKVALAQFRGLNPEPSSVISSLKLVAGILLIGFINGRIKVYNIKKQIVMANFSNLNDYSGITSFC
mmetsp:Transcript_34210/g.33414  ORF Transcript_34210/g.33414 Transcript_34210/m.33414 type:complete len:123 (-) Transcript_34210:1093-1461(-)